MLLLVMGGLLCTAMDGGYSMGCRFASHGGEERQPGVNGTRPDQGGGGCAREDAGDAGLCKGACGPGRGAMASGVRWGSGAVRGQWFDGDRWRMLVEAW